MDIEARLDALEARVRDSEDRLAIINLLMTYGPLVDSGSSEPAAQLWVAGGGYNFDGPLAAGGRLEAPDELVAMYESDGHQALIKSGVSHFTGMPRIVIDGDEAEATGYSFVVLRANEGWYIWRAAVNNWTLVRTADGWRIKERFNRTLNGSDTSLDTMRRAIP